MEIKEKCIYCENIVIGKINRSTGSKIVRGALKKGGYTMAGTIAGSVVPGIGNLIGFATGVLLDATIGDKTSNFVDETVDAFHEDNIYFFKCPNCGHEWIKKTDQWEYELEKLNKKHDHDVERHDYNFPSENVTSSEIDYSYIMDQVFEIIEKELELMEDEIDIEEDTLEDLGADDENIENIREELEKVFEISFPEDSLNDLTIESIYEGIIDTKKNNWEIFYPDIEQIVLNKVFSFISEQLGVKDTEIEYYHTFEDLGADDNDISEIINEIEDEYEIDFSEVSLKGKDIGDVIEMIVKAINDNPNFKIEEDDPGNPDEENNKKINFSEYLKIRRYDQIHFYIVMLLMAIEDEQKVLDEIYKDLDIKIYLSEVKNYEYFGNGLKELIDNYLPLEFNLHNVIAKKFTVSKFNSNFTKDIKEDTLIQIYSLGCLENYGTFVSGIVLKGRIHKGDKLILIDSDDNQYDCEVIWVEMFGKYLDEAEHGDTVGIGLSGKLPELNDFYYGKLIKNEIPNNNSEIPIQGFIDTELEYINEYKEIANEGEISDRDRRFLNKIMKANGISEDRAKELEEMCKIPELSEGELEYLNEYREMISEGEISERDRRFLNKIIDSNGITHERASELEKMA